MAPVERDSLGSEDYNPTATVTIDSARRPPLERLVHRVYERAVLPFVQSPLARQRLKLLYYAPGYWPLLIRGRLGLVWRSLRIDWHVLHGHTPAEIARVMVAITQREAGVVEAGCWHGGSTAKLSLVGYPLHVYDSFQGVEDVSNVPGEWDYSGQYASPETTVRQNVDRWGGHTESVVLHPGWFSETLAQTRPPVPVAVAYIDCDIAKGTLEALQGIVPSLVPGGVIFSQDFHITPVAQLLRNPATWTGLGVAPPTITRYSRRLVALTWPEQASAPST